ncbi:MAG: hypothetical protein IJY82_06780 [Oscillospiraceae bacterium]|nr:hypothetical protein [Oscillospiraceae bacterium]
MYPPKRFFARPHKRILSAKNIQQNQWNNVQRKEEKRMNLICCSASCKYQREGYCAMERPLPLQTTQQQGDCLYFCPREEKNSVPVNKEESSRPQ